MNASIRLRLLAWLAPTLLLAAVAFAVPTYFNVREEVDELFDKVLQNMAYALRQSAAASQEPAGGAAKPPLPLGEGWGEGDIKDATLAGSWGGWHGGPDERGLDLLSQAWDADGRLLYRSHALPPMPLSDAGWASVSWRGEPWRVFSLKTPDGRVQVAQAESERRQTANEVAMHLLLPLLVLLPGLGGMVWFGLGRGLQPLHSVAGAVEQQTPDALQPLPEQGLPSEVGILVAALNGLLRRLDATLAAQRQFIADAAHELRSPLTALSLQAQNAERAADPAQRAAALRTLRQGIARATHLVGQLLALARLEPDTQPALLPLRLDELARAVVADFVPQAVEKGIDLGLARAEPVRIEGEEPALRLLLSNLLDNAIRYTPAGGRIDVRVLATGDSACLEVNDTGPGIPAAERGRVFDRFYRCLGNAEAGSGLGLAIVQRIAGRYGAAVHLADGDGGVGLKAGVIFPVGRP